MRHIVATHVIGKHRGSTLKARNDRFAVDLSRIRRRLLETEVLAISDSQFMCWVLTSDSAQTNFYQVRWCGYPYSSVGKTKSQFPPIGEARWG